MSYAAKLLVLAFASLMLHLLLGWEWTLGAGVAAGLWTGRGGWHLGAASVGLAWLALVAFNYVVNAGAVQLMTETLGSILGNMPFLVIVAVTVLIGVALGALGGAAGTQLNLLINHANSVRHTA